MGDIPGGEEIARWAGENSDWLTRLPQRLFIAPGMGLFVYLPPDAAVAHLFPIDLPAILEPTNRKVLFTSIPPADARDGRGYHHQASAVAAHKPVTFTLGEGPPPR